MLDIRWLGPPVVERDGTPIVVDTRKAIALLARLVVDPLSLPRDLLAAWLWPEADQQHARAALVALDPLHYTSRRLPMLSNAA